MQFSNEIPWTKYLASTCNTPIHCKYYYYLLLLFLLFFLIRKRFSLSHIYRNRLFRPSRRTISFVSFHNSLIVVMFLFSFSLIAQHCLKVCLKWLLALGLNTLTSKNAFWLLIQNRFARVSKRTLSCNFAVAFNCCFHLVIWLKAVPLRHFYKLLAKMSVKCPLPHLCLMVIKPLFAVYSMLYIKLFTIWPCCW